MNIAKLKYVNQNHSVVGKKLGNSFESFKKSSGSDFSVQMSHFKKDK
jgi:hypothetical protein